MQRTVTASFLVLLAATAGCLAPLEYAYYDAKFSESHDAIVGAIRTVDTDLEAHRAGELDGEELEAVEADARARVERGMEALRDPWPARWQESVDALQAAATTYLVTLEDLVRCAERGSSGLDVCDRAVDGLLDVFGLLAEAQQHRPAPA